MSVSVSLILALTEPDRDADADTDTFNYVLSDTNTSSDTLYVMCVLCHFYDVDKWNCEYYKWAGLL